MFKIQRLLLISVGFLTACAPPKPAAELPTNEVMPLVERKAKTNTVSVFTISGAMAAKNKNKGWSASLNWAQQGVNSYQIRLMGPLGGGTVLVNKKGSVVTYKEGGKTFTSSNADELLQKHTGIRLPVSNLYYWVRGLPAPGSIEATKQDKFNHLSQLKQSGYTVDYTRYTSVNGVDLPSLIRLQGQGTTIKLVIKQWKVG
jgi:outer membrane lipoprotein LolB